MYNNFNKSRVMNLAALSLSVLYMQSTEREESRKKFNALYNCFNKSRVMNLAALSLSALYVQSTGHDTRCMHNCCMSQVMNLAALSLSVLCMNRAS